jgi:hypothetical protein
VVDGKTLQVGIGFPFVKAVQPSGIIAGADAGATDIQSQFGGMKQLVKELVAICGGKLLEHVAGRVSKCCAESKDLLKLLLRLNVNHISRRLSVGGHPLYRRGRVVSPLPAGDPRRDIARRCRGIRM